MKINSRSSLFFGSLDSDSFNLVPCLGYSNFIAKRIPSETKIRNSSLLLCSWDKSCRVSSLILLLQNIHLVLVMIQVIDKEEIFFLPLLFLKTHKLLYHLETSFSAECQRALSSHKHFDRHMTDVTYSFLIWRAFVKKRASLFVVFWF